MKIEQLIWLDAIIEKLITKHHVDVDEVEEVLINQPKYRFVERGEREDEDVYMALGKTFAGRYLAVLFIYKQSERPLS